MQTNTIISSDLSAEEKRKQYRKEYYLRNKEKFTKPYNKEYYRQNKERILEYRRTYNQHNADKLISYHKEYRLLTKEKQKEHRLLNREKLKQQAKEHYLRNKEKYIERGRTPARKKYDKEYRRRNKSKIEQKYKEYKQRNKEKLDIYNKEYNKNYRQRNKEKSNQRYSKLYKTNTIYKLKRILRSRLSNALSKIRAKKCHSTLDLVGCSIVELKIHIEKQWQPGMTWENYDLYTWHVDHIKPVNTFDLLDPVQQKQCFHYTNLRPLWAKDNWSRPKDGRDIL
ncbi:hypothetical protein UFOVP760_282 [uncultured Caudovirales phage]|uniref:Uncharacterized protein n=1 Tax=uncultured Caudovirales phage TaxID=2100421 RepID=A0A6J7XC73_9CAUD|nr:hypothetical protein UFOVP760_282 [uncultured Caudovirales phage]